MNAENVHTQGMPTPYTIACNKFIQQCGQWVQFALLEIQIENT